MKKTKRTIKATVRFSGDGVVRELRQGGIAGGTVVPHLGQSVRFLLLKGDGDGGFRGIEKGAFCICLMGNTRGFRALGEYFLSLAELDASQDPGYHDHCGEVASGSQTKIEFMVRKNPKAAFVA